jgi:hypothetical protein
MARGIERREAERTPVFHVVSLSGNFADTDDSGKTAARQVCGETQAAIGKVLLAQVVEMVILIQLVGEVHWPREPKWLTVTPIRPDGQQLIRRRRSAPGV